MGIVIGMIEDFRGSPAELENWACQLLREKGLSVTEALCENGTITTGVDGISMTPGELIEIAEKFREWPERYRRWLEYVNR